MERLDLGAELVLDEFDVRGVGVALAGVEDLGGLEARDGPDGPDGRGHVLEPAAGPAIDAFALALEARNGVPVVAAVRLGKEYHGRVQFQQAVQQAADAHRQLHDQDAVGAAALLLDRGDLRVGGDEAGVDELHVGQRGRDAGQLRFDPLALGLDVHGGHRPPGMRPPGVHLGDANLGPGRACGHPRPGPRPGLREATGGPEHGNPCRACRRRFQKRAPGDPGTHEALLLAEMRCGLFVAPARRRPLR
ncbi:MAG: hypothetical protein IMZ55_03405 [Acidobacteria bacterium]|nr:hypothetical protein [Acidobacteriota bacterium]